MLSIPKALMSIVLVHLLIQVEKGGGEIELFQHQPTHCGGASTLHQTLDLTH